MPPIFVNLGESNYSKNAKKRLQFDRAQQDLDQSKTKMAIEVPDTEAAPSIQPSEQSQSVIGKIGSAVKKGLGAIEDRINPQLTYSRDEQQIHDTGIVRGINIKSYATDPTHEVKIFMMTNQIPSEATSTPEAITQYIKKRAPLSNIDGKMVASAAQAYSIDPALLLAIMQNDSLFGTKGLGAKTRNPGNVGNDDAGNIRRYKTWNDGVVAVAQWLAAHKVEAAEK